MSRNRFFCLKPLAVSLTLSLLAACQPGSLPQTVNPSGSPSGPSPSNSPIAAVIPTSNPNASVPGTTQISGTVTPKPELPTVSSGGVVSLRIETSRSNFSAPGQQEQLRLVFLDAEGKAVNTSGRIEWASSRPGDFSIDATGLVKALAQNGKSEITAKLVGTALIAHLPLSSAPTPVASSSSGSSGGGGGGSSQPVVGLPQTETNPETSPEPSPSPSATPSVTPSTTPAEPTPEFRANTYATNNQTHPVMAMDANGNFVVVWQSHAQDGDGSGIFAQRFNTEGVALGDEFQVNAVSNGEQTLPDVAMRADGTFAIVWQTDTGDASGKNVSLRLYSALGDALSGEIALNSVSVDDKTEPTVALNNDLIVSSWTSSEQDGSQEGVYVRLFDFDGVARGPEALVNQHTTGIQFAPDLALNASGEHVISWTSHAQEGESFDVYARRYNHAGLAQGNEFRVNTTTSSQEWLSSVALNDSGQYVIAWHSNGQDGDGDGVFARAYQGDTALSPELAVNTTTTGHQSKAAIAIDDEGPFSVVWMNQYQDGDDAGVYYRRFSSSGSPLGSETLANSTTAAAQNDPAVAYNILNNTIGIAWASAEQDGDAFGIYVRLFAEP